MSCRNTLTQDEESSILGSKAAIENLAEKDEAQVLLISDSHGHPDNFFRAVEERGKYMDALLFCGDGISDISALISKTIRTKKFAELIPPVIAFVRGNNDQDLYAVMNPLRETNPEAPYYTELYVPLSVDMNIAGMKVYMAHGHRHGVYSGLSAFTQSANANGADVAFYGHTHYAMSLYEDGIFLANPGSCTLPRGGQPPSYAILNFIRGEKIPTCSFFKITPSGSDSFNPLPCPW